MRRWTWKKRDGWVLALVLLTGLAAYFIFLRATPPARYQGKDAWEWTQQYNSPDRQKREVAATALREFGADAVPVLLVRLREREPLQRKIRVWLAAKLPQSMGRALTKDLRNISYSSINSAAALGLFAVGTNASAAVPALVEALQGTERQLTWDAAVALGGTGEAGVLPLIPLLNDSRSYIRHATAYALGQIGPPALAAAPALMRSLDDTDTAVRASALYSLSRIGPAAGSLALKAVEENRGPSQRTAARAVAAIQPPRKLCLPVLSAMALETDMESRQVALEAMGALYLSHTNALVLYREALRDTNAPVRAAGAKALGMVAFKAQPDLPILTALEKSDPEEKVRTAAREAVEKILIYATNAPPKS